MVVVTFKIKFMSLGEETQTKYYKLVNTMKLIQTNGNLLKVCLKPLIACRCVHSMTKYLSSVEFYPMDNCLIKYAFTILNLIIGTVLILKLV